MVSLGFSRGPASAPAIFVGCNMDDVTVQPAAQVPPEILKDSRAISLYWLAVGSLALVPVIAVVGLLLLAALGLAARTAPLAHAQELTWSAEAVPPEPTDKVKNPPPSIRVRVIGENARTLRFSTSEFEDQ